MAVKPNGRGWVDACAVHACGHADGFTKRMMDACALTLRLTLLKWAVQQKKSQSVFTFSVHLANIPSSFVPPALNKLLLNCPKTSPLSSPGAKALTFLQLHLNCVWTGNLLTVCSSKPHISKGLCLPCLVGSPELLAFI